MTMYNQQTLSYRGNKRLAARTLGTNESVVYECPPDRHVEVAAIYFVLVGGGNPTFSLWHLGKNETTSTNNALYYLRQHHNNEHEIDTNPKTLQPGEKLVAKASAAASITCVMYGEAI